MQPQQLVARMEARRGIEPGMADRFAGYALAGLGFESGHIIALRRVSASTIGPPFSSVWLRSPDGEWTVHTNVDPGRSCPRYFGAAKLDVRSDDIDIRWTSARELSISVRRARLHVALRLAVLPAAALIGGLSSLVPAALWRHYELPVRAATYAARVLGLGELTLMGRTGSSHAYRIRPRALWRVAAAAAVIDGADAGGIVPLDGDVMLGDFRVPARGLFAAGEVELTRDAVAAAIMPAVGPRDALLQRVLAGGSAVPRSGTG
jgi:hypothetical protein